MIDFRQVTQLFTLMMFSSLGRSMVMPVLPQAKVTYQEALLNARRWARQHPDSMDAMAALQYIDAIGLARVEAEQMGLSADEGEKTQLLYVLSNLQSWRGPEARSSKGAIKERVEELKRGTYTQEQRGPEPGRRFYWIIHDPDSPTRDFWGMTEEHYYGSQMKALGAALTYMNDRPGTFIYGKKYRINIYNEYPWPLEKRIKPVVSIERCIGELEIEG